MGGRAASGTTALAEIVRKMLLTYWNTVSFHVLYASAEGWTPARRRRPAGRRARRAGPLGAVASCTRLVRDVTPRSTTSTPSAPARCSSTFVDDLSNWYVRRSRRRFWGGDPAALATLHEALRRPDAPDGAADVPFVTERVWQDVIVPVTPDAARVGAPRRWPEVDESLVDDGLAGRVDAGAPRHRAGPGRPRRGQGTRQPLRRALVGVRRAGDRSASELRAQVGEELNVGALELARPTPAATWSTTGQGQLPPARQALRQADAGGRRRRSPRPTRATLAAALRVRTGTVTASTARRVEVEADDVIITERPREGWAVVNERARPSPSTSSSTTSCAGPASPATWSASSRRPASPPAWRSPTGSP